MEERSVLATPVACAMPLLAAPAASATTCARPTVIGGSGSNDPDARAFSVLHGRCAASQLASTLQSNTRLATLYNRPLQMLLSGDTADGTKVLAVAATAPYGRLVCALVAHLLVVVDSQLTVAALSRLAQAAISIQGPLSAAAGFDPHIHWFAPLVGSHWSEPVDVQRRMTWSPDNLDAMAAASNVSMPAGATAGKPESRADFEALAWIDAQDFLSDDPRMERHGLEERVQEMRDNAADSRFSFFVARDARGAVVAMVMLSRETDSTIQVQKVGTLPSHARRGYASGLLAHVLCVKRKHTPLFVAPNNRGAMACYAKIGFVHTAEFASYQAKM